MAKKIIAALLRFLFKALLRLRYKIEIRGLDSLDSSQFNKPGGTLFLPNHTTILVDPVATAVAIWSRFPVRPLIVEYMYYMPFVHGLMRFLDALPVPNFNTATNSIKRKRADVVFSQVSVGLKNGENFLIYPSGRIKRTAVEVVGGSSAVHRILQETPQANIVLVRITGLWGSSFSRALTGQTPQLFGTIRRAAKYLLLNLLFFTPRRHVILEFMAAPSDFPRQGSRLEINSYLDRWYSQYADGLDPATGGEPLKLVSFSCWHPVFPEVKPSLSCSRGSIQLQVIPLEITRQVLAELSRISEMPPEQILPEMNLAIDLGLDSLDIAEVIFFLQDKYDIKGVPVDEVDTVAKVMALAAGQVVCEEEPEQQQMQSALWKKQPAVHMRLGLPRGETLPEVFFNRCAAQPNFPACADDVAGVLTYAQLKMRALLLADYIRKQPGEYIGILLPASVSAYVLVLACQIAQKIPLMVNWTVGRAHLDAVIEMTNVQCIFTAWSFIERLSNVELDNIDDKLCMLEDVRRNLHLKHKLKALWQSKMGTNRLLRRWGLSTLSPHSPAVLLFTSGTEGAPKGVPLSHLNILSNQRGAADVAEIFSNDIMLGILPPFHAFGFTVSGLLPILGGMRVAFSPDPTDGRRVARALHHWSATMLCGAPTFVKGMLKMGTPEELASIRILVTGAEKAPPELSELMENIGKKEALFEGYGITECAPVISLNCPSFAPHGVGLPLPGVELLLVHPENHQPLQSYNGEQGLLLVRGPNVFSGYLNKEVAAPFVHVNGKKWYDTGDLARIDAQGYIHLAGRLKRFVKVGGEMISLSAIEEALLRIASKYAWPLAEEGPSLAVCAKEFAGEKTRFFLFTKFATDIEQVNKALREAGFSNMVKISAVSHLREIPIMGTGKVHYRRLESEHLPSLL